jgi:hypothetical protein
MTIIVANTSNTNTFEYWVNRTNELAYAMTTLVVTTDSNTASGNASISGTFTANVFSGNGYLVTSVNAASVGGNTADDLYTYSDSKAEDAYSNAVSTASADATNKAANAYSNAVSTASSDASSKAATAYSNAVSTAVSTASADATNKAANAYSNAVSYADTAIANYAGLWTKDIIANTVYATVFDLGNWSVREVAGVLYFAYGGVNKMKLDASGNLTVTGNITAYGSV